MKNKLLIVLFSLPVIFIVGGCKKGGSSGIFKSQSDSVSYLVGEQIAQDFKQRGFDINPDLLAKGYKDMMKDDKHLLINEKDKMKVLGDFQAKQQKKEEEKTMKAAQENKKKGQDFLEANKKKEGVKETPSGLQYKIIKEGTGAFPKPTDKVTVNYRGKLIDGKVFDASYDRGEPVSFPLNQVIKGWTEGLQLLKPGGKAELYIPSDLAYGDRGAGQTIPPGSTLIFEVELIKVEANKPDYAKKQNQPKK